MRVPGCSLVCLFCVLACEGAGGTRERDHRAVDAGSEPVIHVDAPVGSYDAGFVDPPMRDAALDARTDLEIDASIDAATDSDEQGKPVGHVSSDESTSDHTMTDVETPDAPTVDASEPAEDAGLDAGVVFDAAVVDAGHDAGAVPDPLPVCSGPPGLYSDAHCSVIAAGIRAFKPQYALWSDGATKQRFVYLPAGTTIDTSNPDRWTFPTGTRLYKEFSKDGTRVETRVLEKTGTGTGIANWTLNTYAWSADQLSVAVVTAGVKDALGSGLDIPTQAQCSSCHNMTGADAPIGFNAIQLNHSEAGVTLAALIAEGRLVNGTAGAAANVTVANAVIAGDAVTKAALGYLHANCGHCHGGPDPRAGQRLWSVVGMTDPSTMPIFQTAVCHCIRGWTLRTNSSGEYYRLRVAPSRAAVSGIIGRMSQRGAGEQMPPLGTNVVDAAGVAAVQAWIDSLDGSACDLTGAVDTAGESCREVP
jgi:hypothetical protein